MRMQRGTAASLNKKKNSTDQSGIQPVKSKSKKRNDSSNQRFYDRQKKCSLERKRKIEKE
jgi:hypothetical protein